MSRDELHLLWRQLCRGSPPSGLVGDLLRRTLAWRLQSLQHGVREVELWKRVAREARAAARRLVIASASDSEVAVRQGEPRRQLSAGTRLIREWKGEMHEVVVLPVGFLWKGTSHRSLSVIARMITGTSWNGWLFFGVARKQTKEVTKPLSGPIEEVQGKPHRTTSRGSGHV